MGLCGARHRTLGLAPVRLRVRATLRPAVALIAGATLLAGCSSLGDITGAAVGIAAGTGSVNPAVGLAVGIATAAAADEGFKYLGRRRQQAEQDAIAAVAGDLPEGMTAPWRIRHDIPIGNEHGEVRVVRVIDNPLAVCREIVFSVLDDPPTPPAYYTTSICQQAKQWKWAAAEPAVERWGYLQ